MATTTVCTGQVVINIHDVDPELYDRLPLEEYTSQRFRWKVLETPTARLVLHPAS
jgi:hypothetical protein